MTYEQILVEHNGDFVTLTLNRPEQRNLLSLSMMSELIEAIKEIGASDASGVVLAASGPVFSSGHDLRELSEADFPQTRALLTTCMSLMNALQAIPQVVVASVGGLATAAGCQLVASCDLAVASTVARFATPGGKGGWFCHTPQVAVARNIGRKRAMEMALTGDEIDATTALDWGLVNRVVAPDQLHAATIDLLERATRGSPVSKGMGKQTFYAQIEMPQSQAYQLATEVMASTSQTPDARERMHAFLEKREPRFGPRQPTKPN
jgi:enoyl-CoA hydratase/carnithine racemase